MYVDVHAHLELCRNVKNVVERAKKDTIIIANGLDTKSNRKCLQFGKEYGNVRTALGLYPSNVLKMSMKEIREELEFIHKVRGDIIAIGEVGMDFTYEQHEKQKKIFSEMIDAAMELGLPLIVHSRKAEEEVIDVLAGKRARKVVMHCFNGNFKLVKKVADNGWSFSIPLTIMKSEHFQRMVREAPLDNILTETDSPYLGINGENEPSNVHFIVEKIASIKGLGGEFIKRKLFLNCERTFGNFF